MPTLVQEAHCPVCISLEPLQEILVEASASVIREKCSPEIEVDTGGSNGPTCEAG